MQLYQGFFHVVASSISSKGGRNLEDIGEDDFLQNVICIINENKKLR